jgi:glycosyltransferase involved in cell wall biosynthesis
VTDRLRILQVNTNDLGGGASKVARDLFQACRHYGHDAWMAVGEKYSDDSFVIRIPNREAQGSWSQFWWRLYRSTTIVNRPETSLQRLLRTLAEPGRAINLVRGVEHFGYPGVHSLLQACQPAPQIVHCHNLHGGYFDLRILPWLTKRTHTILTLHDAWLLSGHCAHSLTCDRWKIGCGSCPDLSLYPAVLRDATAYNWQRKRDIFAQSRLFVATPSQWLMRKVEQSILAPAIIEAKVIPNGVDTSIFRPGNKAAIRAKLGFPHNMHIVLSASNGVRHNTWKDYATMRSAIVQAAAAMPDQPLLFVALGEEAPPEQIGRTSIQFVPYQNDPGNVALYYQAADVYMHAARADTFPSVILEALACGTPVVATAVGGIPEQVDHAQNGFLVPLGDAEALAAHLVQILSNETLSQRMSASACESVRRRFTLAQQVGIYLDWYREIIKQNIGSVGSRDEYALSHNS